MNAFPTYSQEQPLLADMFFSDKPYIKVAGAHSLYFVRKWMLPLFTQVNYTEKQFSLQTLVRVALTFQDNCAW